MQNSMHPDGPLSHATSDLADVVSEETESEVSTQSSRVCAAEFITCIHRQYDCSLPVFPRSSSRTYYSTLTSIVSRDVQEGGKIMVELSNGIKEHQVPRIL